MYHTKFEDVSMKVLCELIDEWIRNEDYREILRMRYLEGYTFERIAEEKNLSVTAAKNIIYKSERIIEQHLKS